MKTLREYIDKLDEISRRGFLKGMGAAALGGIGITASNTATGQASPGFADRVRRFLAPRIFYDLEWVSGNPVLHVSVELAPDGRIITKRNTKASSEPGRDNAVMSALDKAGSLPKDENGNVPRQVNLIFRPKG